MKHQFYAQLRELSLLEGISSLLDWDQQVYMPELGAENRSAQLELLSLLRHERLTSSKLFDAAHSLLESPDVTEQDTINAKGVLRIILREKKLPSTFVAQKSKRSSETFNAWLKAKPANDFKSIIPLLSELVSLAIEEAELVGFEENRYDALLDQYEWEGKVSWVYPALQNLGASVAQRVDGWAEKTKGYELNLTAPIETQKRICDRLRIALGLPALGSRLDASAHPFCTTIGKNDYRITTRFFENAPLSAVLSTLHELGHSLYEAGLPVDARGTPLGTAVSLGVHESQSRLYENMLGRSQPFARFLSRVFKEEGISVSADALWQGLNTVKKSFIRVEADEVTYSLHVLLRMEAEMKLINGEITVPDLPSYWREKFLQYFNITPSSDTEGVLQDVHWYGGSFGYFPTYVLGNIYSGMLLQKARTEIPTLDSSLEAGDFTGIQSFLNTTIYQYGSAHPPKTLIENAAEIPISAEPFLRYLDQKFNG